MIYAEFLTVNGIYLSPNSSSMREMVKRLNEIGEENILSIAPCVQSATIEILVIYKGAASAEKPPVYWSNQEG